MRCCTRLMASSSAWVLGHSADSFVAQARREGFISRSAFKLLHMHNAHTLFSRNTRVVVDLGASPGGWCQVVRRVAPLNTTLIAVDLAPLQASIHGVHFIQGDF